MKKKNISTVISLHATDLQFIYCVLVVCNIRYLPDSHVALKLRLYTTSCFNLMCSFVFHP